jgi:hypothetical protein
MPNLIPDLWVLPHGGDVATWRRVKRRQLQLD